MLTRVASWVQSWTPGGAAGAERDQGLGRILALWPQIAGEDVARHASPIERSGDTLLVLVASSAWNNQLSMLSSQILSALRDAGIEGIERLRFRVGKPRKRRSGGSKAEPPRFGTGDAVQNAPSASVDEAFARFRARVSRIRDAKRARGWNQCGKCGAMLPEGDRCAPCMAENLSERSASVQRLMFDAPWLGYSGIAEAVEGLTQDEYEAIRTTLLARWWVVLDRARRMGKLDPSGFVRRVASSYLLLKTGWEPARITPAISRNELTDELYDLLYGKHEQR